MDAARERFLNAEGWKSFPTDAWNWFLTTKVPLPGLIGVPTLYFAAVNHRRLLHEFIDVAGAAGHFMNSVASFLIFLPASLADLFLRDGLLDSPIPFWIARFWSGFLRGLGGYLDTFFVEQDEDEIIEFHDDVVIELRLKSTTPKPEGEAAGLLVVVLAVFRWYFDRERYGEDGTAPAPAPAPDGRDPARNRTGRDPHAVAEELAFWAAYIRRTIPVLVSGAAALVGVYVLCQFIVEADSACGTSFVCGGPDGGGMFTCFWVLDDAIREASAVAPKPLRYRFYADGTRLQFPHSW